MGARWGGRRVVEARARWAPLIAAARPPVLCSVCGAAIMPGTEWDLDHVTPRVEGGALWDPSNLHPAHRSCNRAAGARLAGARSRLPAPRRPGFFE